MQSAGVSVCDVLIVMIGDSDDVEMCDRSRTLGVQNYFDGIVWAQRQQHANYDRRAFQVQQTLRSEIAQLPNNMVFLQHAFAGFETENQSSNRTLLRWYQTACM